MKRVDFKVGMLIDHPNRPAWGPGKIVHVDSTRVHVFFRDDLQRTAKAMLTELAPLQLAASQTDEVLDKLPNPTFEDGAWRLSHKYASPSEAAAAKPKSKGKRKPAPARAVAAVAAAPAEEAAM